MNKKLLRQSNKYFSLLIIFMITTMIFIGYYIIALVFSIIFLLIMVYQYKLLKINNNQLEKYLENVLDGVDSTSKVLITHIPIPVIVINIHGKILWVNKEYEIIFKDKSSHVKDIFSEEDGKKVLTAKDKIYKCIKIKDRIYDIYVADIYDEGDNKDAVVAIYFSDVTERERAKNSAVDNKQVVILLNVDNLDEVLKSTSEDKRPLLEAEIKRSINSYVQKINAISKEYDSGKYLISTYIKYLNDDIKDKFPLLSSIKEIDKGNSMEVTLSIGAAYDNDSPLGDYHMAVSALDIALGRGGDQVVIKTKDDTKFYGGGVKEVESKSKVRTRVFARALKEICMDSSRVFLMGHSNPDIDSIGSAIGLSSVINAFGKKANIILNESNKGIEDIIIRYKKDDKKKFINAKESREIIDEDSLLIICDTSSEKYLMDKKIFEEFKKIIVIDHHRMTRDVIENPLLIYVATYASSTSEIVTEMIQYMKEDHKLSKVEADALLAGILVDTKNFLFKTGVRTFEAAAYLRSQGADILDIKSVFANDFEQYVAKTDIIKTAVVENGIAIAVSPDGVKSNIIAAQTADELLNITGIKASFVLISQDDDVFISGRSLGDINVQLILEKLGGGGHSTMAGAKVNNSTPKEVVKLLKESINKTVRDGE